VRLYVVSHFNAKLQNWQWAGIYFFQEKSRNVYRIVGLLIKCNSFAESPNLVQQTVPHSPSLLISCSVTPGNGSLNSGGQRQHRRPRTVCRRSDTIPTGSSASDSWVIRTSQEH
jgi:hypothetical protein